MSELIARRVFYSGRVQGVGFRATTFRISSAFDLGGYVRNLDDGRVEVFVEGNPTQVEMFLTKVGDVLKLFIQSVESLQDVPEGLEHFTIRHS